MSFAYKTLSPSDITISPYTANKLYTFASSSLTEYGIVVYSGEYEPIINVSCSDGPATGQVPCNPYNPENDVTSNGYARRLIYDSIQKLYYQSFISGGFSNVLWTSSSYENYLQTALTSGSNYLTNIRIFGQDSGSGGYFYNTTSSIYDTASFPSDPSLIRVISIPQDIFGSGIKPGTFEISSSNYLIQDDGQGNLMDNKAITSSIYENTPYLANVYGGTQNNQGVHVGNIIYSHGMVVITNEDYFCFYPTEPVAQNNSYRLLNVQPTKSLNVLINDFDDCNILDTSSLSVISPLSGYTFPDNTVINSVINITSTAPNNLQVTPGLYKGTYFVSNSIGVPSNYATVSLELYSSPLAINLISYTTGCYLSSAPQIVSFSIDYGVPPYSYALDTPSGWTPISNLYQPTLSFTITPFPSAHTLYAIDNVGQTASFVFDVNNGPILYNFTTQSILCTGGTGSIYVITASSDTPVSVSLSPSGPWHTTYPKLFDGLTSNQILYFTNSLNCSTQSVSLPFTNPLPISITSYTTQSDCDPSTGGNVGAISIVVTGGIPPYNYYWFNTGSAWSNQLLPFSQYNTATPSGLDSGSYVVYVTDTAGTCNSSTSSIIQVLTGFPITYTPNPINVGCYGSSTGKILFDFSGGSGSVTASIYSGSTVVAGPISALSGVGGNITASGLPSGSNYYASLIDARGCAITTSAITIGSPNKFDLDLNPTGALYIYKPGLYDPYTAQFSLHGGNYTSYHVTLSVKTVANPIFTPVVSGSFAGNFATTSISMPVSGVCLEGPISWSISATDNISCSLNNSSSQTPYILPAQVVSSLVQYLPTGSTPPGNDPQNTCTASFSNLYFTASESPNGWASIDLGDHVWENCNLTISASGYAVTSSAGLIAPIWDGVYNPDGIYSVPSCAPAVPPNRLYCAVGNSTFFFTPQIDGLISQVGYNISTNSIVTSSLCGVSGYGFNGFDSSQFVTWSGNNTYFWVDSALSANTSSFASIAGYDPFSIPYGIEIILAYGPKGSNVSQINIGASAGTPGYGYSVPLSYTACLTYSDNYLLNLYPLIYNPILLSDLYDYVLFVSFITNNDSGVCA